MRRAISLLLGGCLVGWGLAWGAPPTTLTPNGFGTTVLPPSNGVYAITGGKPAGGNLYHSFSTFDLGTGDTGNFEVSSSIANILARVTGGPSTIDGKITSTLGTSSTLSSANLFFINPAGVVFTANAQVNLGGSLVVSTANYVKFSDGSIFYGDVNHPMQDAGLTTAPVSAFGFLTTTPQPISFAGSQITMRSGTGLHVIGGNTTVDQGTVLSAPSGHLTLFSAASAGELPFTLASPGSSYATAPFSAFGSITVQNQSKVAIDGAGGGNMIIRGGQIVVDNSTVSSANSGSVAGGGISIEADSLTVRNSTALMTAAQNAQILTSSTSTNVHGTAGNLTLNLTGALSVADGAVVDSITEGAGNAGDMMIAANSVSVDGVYYLPKSTSAHRSQIRSETINTITLPTGSKYGDTGTLSVQAETIDVTNGGEISTETQGNGNGHALNITANAISVSGASDNNPQDLPNNIITNSDIGATTFGNGNAGTLTVSAQTIDLLDTGQINSGTFYQIVNGRVRSVAGAAGKLTINANNLTISGTEVQEAPAGMDVNAALFSAGVFSQADTGGAVGQIILNIKDTLSLSNGGVVSTIAEGTKDAGAISVQAGALSIDGVYSNAYIQSNPYLAPAASGIYSSTAVVAKVGTPKSAKANGGTVDITVLGTLSLTNGGKISTSSVRANAGNITIQAGTLSLYSGSQIDTSAKVDGGNIILKVSSLAYGLDSTIKAEANGGAGTTGGDIKIDPQFVVLDHSLISANDLQGTGGNVTIITSNFLNNDSSITATGATAGTVTISAPVLNLSGSLMALPAALESDEKWLRESCARSIHHEFSSFIVVGRGGTESAPEELQPDFGFDAATANRLH